MAMFKHTWDVVTQPDILDMFKRQPGLKMMTGKDRAGDFIAAVKKTNKRDVVFKWYPEELELLSDHTPAELMRRTIYR